MRRSSQIDSLTGLRGLAALWVLGFHLLGVVETSGLDMELLTATLRPGYLGVDLFFCLSGFVIAHAYCERIQSNVSPAEWANFMHRRFARIYPIHLLTLVALLIAIPASLAIGRDFAAGGNYDAWGLLRHLLLAQVWIPGGSESWNGPSWSIHAEWFAYAVFPLGAGLLWRVHSKTKLLATIIASYLSLFACIELFLDGDYDQTYGFGIVRCVAGFTSGACLWRLWRCQHLGGPALRTVARAWPLVLAALILAEAHHFLVLVGAAMLVPSAVLGQSGRFNALLESPALQYLGKVSYALYMTHHLVLTQLVARLPIQPGSPAAGALWVAGYLSVLLGVAHLSYEHVEVPARRWLLRPWDTLLANRRRT